jgi:hypothetical protein
MYFKKILRQVLFELFDLGPGRLTDSHLTDSQLTDSRLTDSQLTDMPTDRHAN